MTSLLMTYFMNMLKALNFIADGESSRKLQEDDSFIKIVENFKNHCGRLSVRVHSHNRIFVKLHRVSQFENHYSRLKRCLSVCLLYDEKMPFFQLLSFRSQLSS